MARRRAFLPANPWLAVRGLLTVAACVAVAAVMVARASGNLDRTADIFIGVPVSAGLITTQSPVRYHGVNVGRIADIESGTETSRVRLAVDMDNLRLIPSSVVARIVPRTFFGDIYLQLVDGPGERSSSLPRGGTILIDESADAMALYDVFKKIVDVFSHIQPERMQTALTAISQALRNRGAEIGSAIDDFHASAAVLTPSLTKFLDTTPAFRTAVESLHEATPDILATLSAAASVSDRMVTDRTNISAALDAMTGLGGVFAPFLADQREQLIVVVDSVGKVLATTANQPQGLVNTLAGAQAFGEAGGRVFSTGKFNITAVATFAGPMPYDAHDCPVYGTTFGAHCAESNPRDAVAPYPFMRDVPAQAPLPSEVPPPPQPPLPAEAPLPTAAAPASAIVDAEREAHPLGVLQDQLLAPADGAPSRKPRIATVLMLGPLVRGHEVGIP